MTPGCPEPATEPDKISLRFSLRKEELCEIASSWFALRG
jgi:hypothetical protein